MCLLDELPTHIDTFFAPRPITQLCWVIPFIWPAPYLYIGSNVYAFMGGWGSLPSLLSNFHSHQLLHRLSCPATRIFQHAHTRPGCEIKEVEAHVEDAKTQQGRSAQRVPFHNSPHFTTVHNTRSQLRILPHLPGNNCLTLGGIL